MIFIMNTICKVWNYRFLYINSMQLFKHYQIECSTCCFRMPKFEIENNVDKLEVSLQKRK